jgi:hypothetical protein
MLAPSIGDLLEDHWPGWAMNSKTMAVRKKIAEAKGTFYMSDEAVKEFNAYKLIMVASPTVETPCTYAYYPKLYRPIVRFLLCKMGFLSVCLTVRPTFKDKDTEMRYNLFQDGLLRNLIYCHSILDTFYNWLRDTYYPGLGSEVVKPPKRPMDFKRCNALDSWLVHEFVLAGDHSPGGISSALKDPAIKALWDENWDAFKISMVFHPFGLIESYLNNC